MIAKEILELLNKKPRISPIMISKELDTNVQYVRNSLLILSGLGLVKKPARGIYEISETGRSVLKKLSEI